MEPTKVPRIYDDEDSIKTIIESKEVTDMELIPWDEEKSIGIEEIDNDHRYLIGLINKFNKARSEGRSVDVLSDLLERLKKYSREHFAREEAYMLKTEYPRYFEHWEQHQYFIKKVGEFETEYQFDKELLAIRIMPFMMKWLLNHIMTTDKQLAQTQRPA